MKDLLIAVAVLAILVTIFSLCDAPLKQDSSPVPELHGSGTRIEGESDVVIPGDNPGMPAEPPQSPKTGYRHHILPFW